MPALALQRVEQLEDLRLDRDVERRGRLVGDQQRGSQASAIAIITRWRMPPRELVRIGVDARGGSAMPTSRSSAMARRPGVAQRHALRARDRLGDLVADVQHRVERRHRLLEDHRDAAAADVTERASSERERSVPSSRMRVLAEESWPGGGQAQHREGGQILPQPDSPTSASSSPRSISKLTSSTGRSGARRVGEGDAEVLNLEQGGHRFGVEGCGAVRRRTMWRRTVIMTKAGRERSSSQGARGQVAGLEHHAAPGGSGGRTRGRGRRALPRAGSRRRAQRRGHQQRRQGVPERCRGTAIARGRGAECTCGKHVTAHGEGGGSRRAPGGPSLASRWRR